MTDIWQAALSELETKVSSHNFESWFKHMTFHHQEGRVAHLEVQDEFYKAWIEENYIDLIEESLSVVAGTIMRAVIHMSGELDQASLRLEIPVIEPLAARQSRQIQDPVVAAPSPLRPEELTQAHGPSSRFERPIATPHTYQDTSQPRQMAPLSQPAPQESAAPLHAPAAPSSSSAQGEMFKMPPAHLMAPPRAQEAPAAPAPAAPSMARRELGQPQAPAAPTPAIKFPQPSLDERIRAANLNPRYSFDEFVVGPSNQFTHAACVSIANSPGQSYNPLFIFGGVGLGKTHLLQAVGIQILKKNPSMRVVNLSSEEFMNQLINGLRQRDMNSFRDQYRNNCDVLLIDDIQFIGGKDSTQEEFFHTFNALHQAGKHIVITSDKPPKDLPGIEERLQSRFSWGLIADIQPPEIETRIAILEKKAEDDGIALDKEVCMLLASSIRSNVRELEGTLVGLSAQASLLGQPISMEMARQHLRRMNIEQSRTLTVERIIALVADFFGISSKDICGSQRTRTISQPRQFAMYLSRKLTDHSYPEIGRLFGGKDHTTVLAACRKMEKQLKDNGPMVPTIRELEALLDR